MDAKNIFGNIRLYALLTELLLVNVATWHVTTNNQIAGVYPIDADSIGIPIGFTILCSMILLPFQIFIGIYSNGNVKNLNSKIFLSASYLIAISFSIYGFCCWSVKNHYLIAASYAIMFIFLLFYLVLDWRENVQLKKSPQGPDDTGL